MAEHRPFPPSARRRGLARRAGLVAGSPVLVGAAACGAAALGATALAPAAAARLADWIAAACSGHASMSPTELPRAVLTLAAPLLCAIAGVAIAAHLAQTRAPWAPRRTIPEAPELPGGAGARLAAGGRAIVGAVVLGGVALGWLWTAAPRIARLVDLPARNAATGASALIVSAVAALAIAWLALGALDALARWTALAGALRMTDAERREDARRSAADPRWRERRAAAARGPHAVDAVAASAVVLLGDELAVAIAWDPRTRPVPTRLATGARARATQLVGLARRHRVPVHRDAELAAALAQDTGPVPAAQWPRLAEIIAAVRA